MQRSTQKDQHAIPGNHNSNTSNADEDKPSRRGRPRKLGKLKIPLHIVATGKGRGRPKKPPISGDELGGDVVERPLSIRYSKTETRGRPRKEKIYSDSENSSYDDKPEYEERRPVGRPSTGAVNLNIVRTGRGQGRPRKSEKGDRSSLKHDQSTDAQVVRKRGRPSKGGVAYKPSGKPRGRPKIYIMQNEPEQSGGEVEIKDMEDINKEELKAIK